MNADMVLEIYESQELTDAEKDYLLTVANERTAEEEMARAGRKVAAANSLRPVRAVSSAAAIGGGGSWLVFNNKLRKAEAELQKNVSLEYSH